MFKTHKEQLHFYDLEVFLIKIAITLYEFRRRRGDRQAAVTVLSQNSKADHLASREKVIASPIEAQWSAR
ncbi:hypothetical protein CXR24_01870 [Brevibacterium aurantiacum]|nr:hypothetical protein CXR24_01870 [Brevibacterium aurantiacum]